MNNASNAISNNEKSCKVNVMEKPSVVEESMILDDTSKAFINGDVESTTTSVDFSSQDEILR